MPSRSTGSLIALLLSYALGCGGTQDTVKSPESTQSPGKAVLMVTACDKEGDDITLEAEVVPRGQPRSGVPTHTKVTSFKKVRRLPYYQDTFCAKIELPLSGLATSMPYDIAYRVFDSQGADGSESSGGFAIEP